MKEIKFRAWDGERLRNVWSMGWIDEEMDYISTPKYNGPAEDFKLMQYTWLKDKSGCEIYEGDIVIIGDYPPYEVIVNDISMIHCLDNELGQEELFKYHKNCRVVGNIYENPELLEGAAQ